MGTVQRAHAHMFGESSKMVSPSNNNNNSDQLPPPETLPSEMSLSSYMDAQWDRMTLSSSGNKNHPRGCNRIDDTKGEPSTSAMAASNNEASPKRHNTMDRLVGMFSDLGSAAFVNSCTFCRLLRKRI